ncbi:hypothetical protein [Saprospira grandis]|uniref:Uncharacterized protein n=1 Tax=Saprospira grandis (strain Lewin) TaxID=984262 RepID=H6L7F1_SAPGL|nr:hypothetical protein [Saprospira grandis]AFC26823.1 hypothetical protein SGRA_4108 [Saprospira grandis str. Lewin]
MDGKFVLHTYSADGAPAEELLEGDSYERNISDPQKGDVGIYYLGSRMEHVEKYESSKTVSSKGGVGLKQTGLSPQKTWEEKKFDRYEVVRKSNLENTKVSTKEGSINNGVRTVNQVQFDKIQQKVKGQ